MPDLLRFQNSFEAAVKLLQDDTVEKGIEGPLREIAGQGFVPEVGIIITRPESEKARSIKHCCQLAA
jgi:DNA ligase 4